MENYKNKKPNTTSSSSLLHQRTVPPPIDDLTTRTSNAFEYSFPTSEADDTTTTGSTCDSNNSTPYYTPLEFFQSSFEFPSPKLIDTENSTAIGQSHTQLTDPQYLEENDSSSSKMLTTSKSFAASAAKQLQTSTSSTSPGISNRKLRRFTFNERRSCSCSPQHLLSKNSSVESGSESTQQEDCTIMDVDKENTKPKYQKQQDRKDIGTESGNNSPIILYDESSGSPKIFTASDANSMLAAAAVVAAAAGNNQRLTPYSPKLLNSINNLNLSSGGGGGGSPLGVISSAGYKHGNYFKFPEIDHIVQEHTLAEQVAQIDEFGTSGMQADNQIRNRQKRLGNTSPASPLTLHLKSRFKSSSLDIENVKISSAIAADVKSSELVASASHDGIHLKNLPVEQSKTSAIQVNTNTTTNTKTDARKMRKNKNNLTIRITDVQQQCTTTSMKLQQQQPPSSPSPSPKPKTPTIKSTKEKALSLDSAAAAGETRLTVACGVGVESYAASYDEIDAQALGQTGTPPPLLSSSVALKQRSSNYSSHDRLRPELGGGLRNPSVVSIRSTSLSQLATPSQVGIGVGGGKAISSQRSGETILSRSNRRRVPGTPTNEWLQYHRKQNPFKLNQNLNADSTAKKASLDTGSDMDLSEVVLLKEDDEGIVGENAERYSSSHLQSTPSSSSSTSSFLLTTPTHRGIHKHNPILHASNTNLKTLPEFLTLVEFSTTTGAVGGAKEHEYPYKQKSIDLPSSTLPQPQAMVTHPTGGGLATARTKNIASSSNNLLQRRGSNHSLTLNLHGSCSNLLGSCRSGFSVSNYSLGSVANSTNNLNSKSSCNLNVSNANTPHSINVHPSIGAVAAVAAAAAVPTTQDAKQSLFRRGSNAPNLTATSCGNLNTFASQNSLHVDRSNMGVTRTTSFITPTKNTNTSSMTPKRGLLERRGSNQSFTLNMSSSFGGIGSEQNTMAVSHLYLGDAAAATDATDATESQVTKATPAACCAAAHQRKFFSSESLNRANTQFSDLNQAHKRNAKQVCFGSVSDLKPNNSHPHETTALGASFDNGGGAGESPRRDHFNFQESTICSCTGVRNIATRPLSPQTTSEEFKIYLANIQMLQNATNALNQLDLIKLNFIFDNSYATSNSMVDQPLPLLSMPPPPTQNEKGTDTPPGLLSTSEDSELAARYLAAVRDVLPTVQPDDNEQKLMFRGLHKEFWDLPLNHQEKPMVFGSQTKNRYKTILPNENSRVLLDRESKHLAEYISETSTMTAIISKQFTIADEVPYINANYIKGPDYTSKSYIATQGPLPNTIFEFWLMIYQNTHRQYQKSMDKAISPQIKAVKALQQYYQKIVMLTSILENNRQKCSVYFPVELNEIFITTYKQEVMPPSDALIDFFDAYLKTSDKASPPPPNYPNDNVDNITQRLDASIETFQLELDVELGKQLFSTTTSTMPPSNFFVLKNIGIVKKNGFSIRKIVVLYCVHLPPSTTETKCDELSPPHQLLVQKFYCFHYWYPDWPDHRSPRDINTLLDISLHILNLGKCETEFDVFNAESPASTPEQADEFEPVDLFQQDIFNNVQPLPVIHCSAGIGRTGCLTAILNGVRQLRQSLAYSLTSMATTVSKGAAGTSSAATQLLSPVDFCLPTEFLKEVRRQQSDTSNQVVEMNNDTDSSFTRSTFEYIKYIKRMQKAVNDEEQQHEKEMTEFELEEEAEAETLTCDSLSQLPALHELPKLPDVFVDILGIVCNLRLQRGGMVQNSEQYELVYRTVCLYLKRTFALKRF